jgi:hypothetical protein
VRGLQLLNVRWEREDDQQRILDRREEEEEAEKEGERKQGKERADGEHSRDRSRIDDSESGVEPCQSDYHSSSNIPTHAEQNGVHITNNKQHHVSS